MSRFITCCLLALVLTGAMMRPALACPNCRDAVTESSGIEGEDPVRLGRAYNNSIYLMLIVPYGAVMFMGLMVYRHLRVRAAHEARFLESLASPAPVDSSPERHPGDAPCSTTSPVADS